MGHIYTVTQVNAYLRGLIEDDVMLSSLEVRGELSNVRYNSSGHIYFTIKDGRAAVSCVMFASDASTLRFRLTEGTQVIVSGSLGVYERAGTCQIYVRRVRLEGSGELYERYLKLKAELEEMGMFSDEYKQPVPAYINTLGVVTAATGAAVQDIINVSRRRDPYIKIVLCPAKVQGEGAAESIAAGIRALDSYGVDTIIVGRGGGTIEDLWAFNEETVARAIFECRTPLISAVGHETDTTIADFAADLRAPTPSAAAELAVFDYEKFVSDCSEYEGSLKHMMAARIDRSRQKLDNISIRLHSASPEAKIRERRMRLDRLESDMGSRMKSHISDDRNRLAVYIERLKGLSPLDKLQSGYSFVEDEQDRPVCDVDRLSVGQTVKINMKNGRVFANVSKIERT